MAIKDPVEFRLYDTDLTTVLGILPALSMKFYLQLNEPGSGEVSIALDSRVAPQVGSDMFVEARYRGDVRGGFFVENIDRDEAGSGENEARRMSLTGRGALAILDEAIVWDDGSDATTREFTGPRAGMLIELIEEAKGRGGLQNLGYDFSETDDSDADAWTDNETLTFAIGTKLLDVARQIAKTGIDFTVTPDGAGNFILSAYQNGIGTDKSETVYFRVGVNCEEMSSLEMGGADLRNVLRAKYNGGFAVVKDDTSITNHRRREAALDVSYASSVESATTFASAELETKKQPKRQISLRIYDGIGPRAFEDYALGDRITVDNQGVEADYRIRGMQLAWDGEKFADVVVDLNSIILETDIRMAQDVDYLRTMWLTARDANLLEVRKWVALTLQSDIIYEINALLVDGDTLWVAGKAPKIGGIATGVVVSYDMITGQWTTYGNLSVHSLECICKYNGKIYVAGNTSLIYEIDGTTVTLIGGGSFLSSIHALATDGTYLYAGGDQTDINGVSNTDVIAKWDGSVWSGVGGGLTGIVYALLWTGSELIIGGDIPAHNNIVSWDLSAYNDLDTGLDGVIRALGLFGTTILAGGEQTDFLSAFDGAGWTTIAGITDVVRALGVHITDIYIGGDFDEGIVRYSGGTFYSVGNGVNGEVFSISFHDTTVIVGGDNITIAGGDVTVNQLAGYFTNFESLLNQLANAGSNYDLGAGIHNAFATTTLADADEVPLWQSASSFLKKITWANIKAALNGLFVRLTTDQTVGGVKTFTDGINSGVTPPSGGGAGSVNQAVEGASAGHIMWTWGTGFRSFISGLFARGTKASPTAAQDNDVALRTGGRWHDGTTYGTTAAEIRYVADENQASGAHGTRIEAFTTPIGSTTLTLAMTIGSDGAVILTTIKSGASQGAAGAVAGEIWKTAGHATLPDDVLMIGV